MKNRKEKRRWFGLAKRVTAARRALRFESLERRNLLTTFDLGQARVTILGADIEDESGISVRSAGDVNGDGFDDVVIGARYGDAAANIKNAAGESYLLFGRATWGNSEEIDLANLGGAGVTLFGADAFDYSGRSVSAAGDVNGDGFDDFLIGAVEGDGANNIRGGSGETYLIFGKADWSTTPTLNMETLGTAGVTIFGADFEDFSGRSVSGGGDINGDGFDDIIIGASYGDAAGNLRIGAGETTIVFGKADWSGTPTLDLGSLGANGVTIFGAEAGDASGLAVSNGGDINGDGFDDILIGARFADAATNNKTSAGESYIVFGKASWTSTPTIDLATLGVGGVTIFGVDAQDFSGESLNGVGDVNGDGFDDFLIGAVGGDGSDGTANQAGEAYLVFGKATWLNNTLDLATLGTAGVKFFGAEALDQAGLEVNRAGDINGDGFDDLLIAARYADATNNGKTSAGETYVLFGEPTWPQTIQLANAGTLGLRFFGADTLDYSGMSASYAGDLDGDGFDDLIIGAPRAERNQSPKADAGETYIVFGSDNFTSSVTRLGSPTADTLTGTTGEDVIVGNRGNDTLVGLGDRDVLRGGEGDDVLAVGDLDFLRVVGGSGHDTLRLDGANLHLDLTTRADNRILGIEEINLRGAGANTLTLNLLEVLNLSDESNTLIVLRDANDVVNRGAGWTRQPDEMMAGVPFEVYTQGAAILKIQSGVADLSVTFVSSVDNVLAGNTLFYTGTLSNGGPALATGTRLQATLANGLIYDAANSTAGCTAAGLTITCDQGTIAANTSKSVQIAVRVAPTVADGTVLNTVAVVTHNEEDPDSADRTATASVTVDRQVDVKVTMTPSTLTPFAGAALNYSIKIDNDGPSDASGVTITDTLPAGLNYFAQNSSGTCSAQGQVVTCVVGVIPAGTSVTRQIGTRLDSSLATGTVLNNTAQITLNEDDLTTNDHSSSASVTAERQVNLSVTKTASANPVLAGSAFHYTIEVLNSGPSDATGVDVADILSSELTFNAAGSSSACMAAAQNITCNIGTLVAGTSTTQTIAVTVDAAATRGTVISNTATVNVTEPDPNQNDQSSTVTVTVNVEDDPTPWQNVTNHRDVNNDTFVTPIDALQIINELNLRKFSAPDGKLPDNPPPPPYPFLDVTGDNFVVPQDALNVINFLNAQSGNGEGEGSSERDAAVAADAFFSALQERMNARSDDRRDSRRTVESADGRVLTVPENPETMSVIDGIADDVDEIWNGRKATDLPLEMEHDDLSLKSASLSE